MLGSCNPYMHVHVPHLCPSRNFFILTLHTFRPWLDWPLIWASTSQPKRGDMWQPIKKKFHRGVGHFRPIILTLHTLRQWLDWPLISVWTLQPKHEMHSSQSKKISQNFTSRPITRKPLIIQILKRWLLVGKKVPYKFPNDIISKLSTLHGVNWWFICWPKNGKFFEWP